MSQIRPAVPVWRLLPSECHHLGAEEKKRVRTNAIPIRLIMHQKSFHLFFMLYVFPRRGSKRERWFLSMFICSLWSKEKSFCFRVHAQQQRLSHTLSVYLCHFVLSASSIYLSFSGLMGRGALGRRQQEIALWSWIMDEKRASYENKCQCKNSPPLDPLLPSCHPSACRRGVWGLKATDMLRMPIMCGRKSTWNPRLIFSREKSGAWSCGR